MAGSSDAQSIVPHEVSSADAGDVHDISSIDRLQSPQPVVDVEASARPQSIASTASIGIGDGAVVEFTRGREATGPPAQLSPQDKGLNKRTKFSPPQGRSSSVPGLRQMPESARSVSSTWSFGGQAIAGMQPLPSPVGAPTVLPVVAAEQVDSAPLEPPLAVRQCR